MIQTFLPKTLKNTSFQNFTIYGFGQAFNLITPILVAPYIILTCGEENYGKTSIGMAISFFCMVFIDYGTDISGLKEVSIARKSNQLLNEIFLKNLFLKSITFTIVLLFLLFIISTTPFFKNESTLYLLGLTVLFGQLINPIWFLQGIENVKWITWMNIVSKSFFLIFIFLLIKNPDDYVYVNLIWGLGMIVAHLLLVCFIWKKYNFKWHLKPLESSIKQLRSDFTFFTSQIFVSLQMYAPVVLIGMLGSNILAGQYRIIEQIIVVFKTYLLLFFNFIFPKICFLLQENKPQCFKSWFRFNGLNYVIIFIGCCLIFIFNQNILSFFNATDIPKLSVWLKTSLLIPLILGISIPLKQLILGLDWKNIYIKSTIFQVIITIGLLVCIIPNLDLFWLFVALILSELSLVIFYIYKLNSQKPFHG